MSGSSSLCETVDFYKDRCVLLTGVTGFIGKIVLWKLLKEISNLRVITLIRPRKNLSAKERLQRDVLSTECFDSLRESLGPEEWNRRASAVQAVEGDLGLHRLGLSEKDQELITANTHIIIHVAATVNFTEELRRAAELNILGPLRIVALASRCPQLLSCVHTSTCYVNWKHFRGSESNPSGRIEEKLYPLGFHAEDVCRALLATDTGDIPSLTQRWLDEFQYPNTYTLTKSIGEHLLVKRAENVGVPLTIVRPSIVGCCWREPMPGWCDSLTAAGGVFAAGGVGLLRELHCELDIPVDLVPADFVAKTLILAAQHCGESKAITETTDSPSSTLILQCSTSDCENPLRWSTTLRVVHHPSYEPLVPNFPNRPNILVTQSKRRFHARVFVRRLIPLWIWQTVVQLVPSIRKASWARRFSKVETLVLKTLQLQTLFEPFMTKTWTFESRQLKQLIHQLPMESQQLFGMDTSEINWASYTEQYFSGIARFVLGNRTRTMPPVRPSQAILLQQAMQ